MFPGSEDSDAYKAISTHAAEEEPARRAAIPRLRRCVNSTPASTPSRDVKPSSRLPQHDSNADLERHRGWPRNHARGTAAATAERNAAAARVAIPSAIDPTVLEAGAHSSIQTLLRVSEIAGHNEAANTLRGLLERSADIIRDLAAETAAAQASAADAPHPTGSAAHTGIAIEYVDDQDMEEAEEVSATQALPQRELDTPGLDLSSQRAAAIRPSIRVLAKRPRKTEVAKQHLRDRGRVTPSS